MAYVFPAKGHEPGQPRPGTDGPILVYDFDGPRAPYGGDAAAEMVLLVPRRRHAWCRQTTR